MLSASLLGWAATHSASSYSLAHDLSMVVDAQGAPRKCDRHAEQERVSRGHCGGVGRGRDAGGRTWGAGGFTAGPRVGGGAGAGVGPAVTDGGVVRVERARGKSSRRARGGGLCQKASPRPERCSGRR